MGNRALIEFDNLDLSVYLHWNGGRDSVEAFLEYCRLRRFRAGNYGVARFCQVVGNFFGGSLSIGIYDHKSLDNEFIDNGTYIVENWQIVKRIPEDIEEQNEYNMIEMLDDIDKAQPSNDRLGEKFIHAKVKKLDEISVGDLVYITEEDSSPSLYRVIGKTVNPNTGKKCPYTNQYGEKIYNASFLKEEEYRVIEE